MRTYSHRPTYQSGKPEVKGRVQGRVAERRALGLGAQLGAQPSASHCPGCCPGSRQHSCPPPADAAARRAATGQPNSGDLSSATSPPRRCSSPRHQEKHVPACGTLSPGGPEPIKSRRPLTGGGGCSPPVPTPRRTPSHLWCCLQGLLESGGWCSSASDPCGPHLLGPGRPPSHERLGRQSCRLPHGAGRTPAQRPGAATQAARGREQVTRSRISPGNASACTQRPRGCARPASPAAVTQARGTVPGQGRHGGASLAAGGA